ncbi:MAG: LamG domain-containing protein, partial [Candidatus Nanohaloarchaea archaeon]|nr:LamG domain-containing protein [Candidatus Nanohaloarchaea archaeon]
GQWHHVAGVYDPDEEELRFYLDGRLDGTASGVSMDSNSDNGGELHIGESPNYAAAEAVVDDFRVYNRTLPAGRVEGIARNGIGLNVSADLSPRETKTLQIYYGNPGAADPDYDGSTLQFTAMDQRPSVSVGVGRGIREIMRKMQENVGRLDASLGIDLSLAVRKGCNRLILRSPRTSLVKDLC